MERMSKMMQIIMSYFASPLVILWVVGVGIFLGDGKQPAADAFFAISIVLLFGWALYKKQIRTPSQPLFIAWVIFLFYNLALIPFSDGPGFSITNSMRLVMVFLVFLYGYSHAEHTDIKKLEHILLGIVGIACLTSFVLLFFPDTASKLPLMNLLYPTYGHNHIVDLLLLGIPIGLYRYIELKNKTTLVALVLFFITLFFSFARGAIALVGIFLLFFLWKNKTHRKSVLFLFGFIVILLIGVSSIGKFDIPMFGNYKISITKPKLTEDGRFEYWRQALIAIKERPWFGSGPGTFSLESRRLQDRPGTYSWFAHSFPLETLVETGIVGAALLLIVGWQIAKNLRHTETNKGVLWATGLTFLYSLFEFNLSYISITLLAVFILGLNIKNTTDKGMPITLFILPLFMLLVYYFSFVGSMVFSATGNDTAAFYSAPYLEQTAKQMILKDEDKKGEHTRMITWFHAMNPDIHAELGKKTEDKRPREAMTHFYLASKYDPQNLSYYGMYMKNAIATNNNKQVARGLMALIDNLKKQQKKSIVFPELDDERVYPFLNKESLECVIDGGTSESCLSKTFYLLGLNMIMIDKKEAINYLQTASDFSPKYGYFYAELASVYRYEVKDDEKISEIVRSCLSIEGGPLEHCRSLTGAGLPRLGFYKTKILKIY